MITTFGLTGSEARVAAAIAAGKTPADIAEAHGVTLATIRTQVSSVHDKLSVRRQSDLVRLLSMSGSVSSGHPS